MTETGIDNAVYLVFWFPRDAWAESDSQRRQSTFPAVSSARSFFDAQAGELSADGGLDVRASVIDASLP